MSNDEAQSADVPVPVKPDNFEPEPYDFRIELRLDATVTVNGENWLKPGVTTGHAWKIRHGILPSREELSLAMTYMQEGVLNPVMGDMIDEIHQRVAAAQMNR